MIFLHGLGGYGPKSVLGPILKILTGPALGLSSKRNTISYPKAPHRPTLMLPPTMIPGVPSARSWFNFWALPGLSVISPFATESKDDLKESLRTVEVEIEKMIQEGIPSENIVLIGGSQGGALTLYTALHTQYKLGGFISIVAWLPLLRSEPPASLPTPINRGTPILHLNGEMDLIVPLSAGYASSAAMKQVFTNYQLKNTASTHITTINPINISKVYCWLKKNLPKYLTDGIFETGAYRLPSKSQNPTVLGQGGPSSTQCSNPSWACRWHRPFGTSNYLVLCNLYAPVSKIPSVKNITKCWKDFLWYSYTL